MGISPKEKGLTDLDQNQNFGKFSLEFYLAEALLNLPEFGSEQTMKFEATYTHNVAACYVGDLISQCGDPFRKYIIYSS